MWVSVIHNSTVCNRVHPFPIRLLPHRRSYGLVRGVLKAVRVSRVHRILFSWHIVSFQKEAQVWRCLCFFLALIDNFLTLFWPRGKLFFGIGNSKPLKNGAFPWRTPYVLDLEQNQPLTNKGFLYTYQVKGSDSLNARYLSLSHNRITEKHS